MNRLLTELKPESNEQELLTQSLLIANEQFPLGSPVKILHTDYIGIIDRYNNSKGGFYPGYRYPVFVKITDCKSDKFKMYIGKCFQYSLDQLQPLLENVNV